MLYQIPDEVIYDMMTKFASFEVSEVLDVRSSPSKAKVASFKTVSDFHDYRTDDGYMYVRIRAISSRTNKNNDGWPTAELAGGSEEWEKISGQHHASEGGFRIEADTKQRFGFSTFIGKPIFVDHNNSDPRRARGVIVDSAFNVLDVKTAADGDEYWGSEDVDPEHNPPAEVELLLEVDAEQFPKFAKSIIEGDLDGFSMGCDVEYSKCSHCDHKASTPDEYCSHIQAKGAEHDFKLADGTRTSKRSYENCYGISFFEISGVFDPADETALTKEVRASLHKEAAKVAQLPMEPDQMSDHHVVPCMLCQGTGREQQPGHSFDPDSPAGACPMCHGTGDYRPSGQEGHDGMEGVQNIGGPDDIASWNADAGLHPVPHFDGLKPHQRMQGSYLAAKTAEAKEPQDMHVKAPEDVNTLREEKVCPLCGSDVDSSKCDVCGWEEPPESLQNPDLSQAHEVDLSQQENSEITIPAEGQEGQGVENPADPDAQSYLKARNPQPTASVISSMHWAPTGIKLASPKTQGDEPNETVTSDQTEPVTSAFRTAKDLIALAAEKRNQETKNMSTSNKVAADPADASGKAKKQVDVEGVGGVDDASPEALGADKQVDVEGKGGVLDATNEQASAPDHTDSVEQTSDNAGFQPGGQKGEKTQSFPEGNNGVTKNAPGVTNQAYPTAAAKGAQPVDPVGKADDRIDVEAPPHDRVGDSTDQWTGTGGNGVTKQVDPVTNKPTQSQGIQSSHVSLAALKLADTEVELGIITKDEKYNRLAALSDLSDLEIKAEERALAKVKQAGFSRTASRSAGLPSGRMPSFSRIASTSETAVEPQPVNDALMDNALFTR